MEVLVQFASNCQGCCCRSGLTSCRCGIDTSSTTSSLCAAWYWQLGEMGREWPHHVPSCRWSSVVIYSCTFKIGCQQCHLRGLFASLCQVGSELIDALNMLGRLSQNWHGLPDAGHMASIWQANSSGKNSFQSWMCEKMGKGRSEMIWKLADVPTFFSVILLRRQRHRGHLL